MASRKKHIIFVHGRHFKPDESVLKANWVDVLKMGVERDCTAAKLKKYMSVKKTMAYYGDISNEFLRGEGGHYNKAADTADRKKVLAALKEYTKGHFSKPQAKKIYTKLPGKTSKKEFLADAFGSVAAALGISKSLISLVAPDMEQYWNQDEAFGSDARWRLTDPLAKALRRNEDVLLISHSLGSMIAYDVLWKFSHYGEYQDIRKRKVTRLITLGAPLGDPTVRANLKGASASGTRQFPANIELWDNFAAEDDFISHDQTLKNDFKKMVPDFCSRITDHRIYNLAVRSGKSNPHHGTGYLVHPKVIELVTSWL